LLRLDSGTHVGGVEAVHQPVRVNGARLRAYDTDVYDGDARLSEPREDACTAERIRHASDKDIARL